MHIDSVTSRSFKLLGFVKRSTKEFKNVSTIVSLYKTLIRPILLYCHQIWSPTYNIYADKLESVQHRFFRYASYKAGSPMSYENHNYTSIATSLNIETINSLHTFNDVFFVKKVK